MKKRVPAALSSMILLMSGCQKNVPAEDNTNVFSTEDMNRRLIEETASLPQSSTLYFKDGIEITGLGVTFDGRPTSFDGCYYFPAIEKMTGAHVAVDWADAENYSAAVAATLLSGKMICPI
ncbi:MAG: hypothetical protein ACI4Q6_00040 [Huintestinicola sp.]